MADATGARVINTEQHAGADEAAPVAHALELTAWDLPPAVGAGERFHVHAGVRCVAGCDLGGKVLGLFNQHDAPMCSVSLEHTVWPGTEALYFARIEACAPLEPGSYPWQARVTGWEGETPHGAAACALTLQVVAAPDCEVTVKVVERESQTPIAGARVVMHPYRAVTDENGIAKVNVSKGGYDLLVSGRRYLPYCASIEVSDHRDTLVELDVDQPDEEGYE